MNLTIFAKPPFLNVNPGQPYKFGTPIKRGHLMRVSSIIRGIEMSEYLNCKLNPTSGYEDDVCIYVKPNVPKGLDFTFEGKPYLDIIDGWGLTPVMMKHPDVPIITISRWDSENLARVLKNEIIFIPQRHFNYSRVRRYPDSTINVGVVGTRQALPFLPGALEDGLAERGMKLVEMHNFEDREKIVEFHQTLYIQIVWRPYRRKMGNPLKLVNAASVGVPTIALEEPCLQEMEGYYLPVHTLEEFFAQLDKLRADPGLYNDLSDRCFAKAEEYHIENIAKLYRNLCTT
jgi:glycosyltransferase involved in cell wall biosynthesis